MTGEWLDEAVIDDSGTRAVRRDAHLDELRGEWTALAAAGANIFSTWEWASTWWRHAGDGRRLLLRAGRDLDGRLEIVIPLYLWSSRPLRVARLLGHGPADQLGPVCQAASRPDAAEELRAVVADASLDLVLAELLPRDEGWRSMLASSPLAQETSPTVSIRDGWEAYLAARSANLRQQIGARERRLTSKYEVRFRLAADPARLQEDLTLLFSLHGARWENGSSPFTRWEGFHRDFAAVALEQGWLRLWFLELDGTPAAAWYGFRFAGVESYYQAGRDPRRSNDSIGFVLLAHSIREAAADGMREYRFLRGGEAFKLRFGDEGGGLETLALSRGLRGRVGAVAAAAGLRSGLLRRGLGRLAGASRS